MSRPKRVIISGLLILGLALLLRWTTFFKERILATHPSLYPFQHFPFSNEHELSVWDEKVLRGRVNYRIEEFNGESCVYARSNKAASALYHKTKIDIERHPVLSWRWNVIKFPEKRPEENLADSGDDDFGARMYVIFPGFFLGGMRALEYVWTEYLPKGVISSSPYTSNIKLIVLESGYNKGGGWVCEKRDLNEDYMKAFGETPRSDVGAIAFMTDADSTGSTAEAVYDDLKIEYKKEIKP